MNKNITFLAPYGSMKFAPLVTKVGGEGKGNTILAPYGSMKLTVLATKVSGKTPASATKVSL